MGTHPKEENHRGSLFSLVMRHLVKWQTARSRLSDQDGKQVATVLCPSTEDTEAWQAYWQAQGQLWRTEPEIDKGRQEELAQRRAIVPDIEKGIYPFKGMKLCRADVEWLLATHENGRGPVDWSDKSQRERIGLDLRGADLRRADLHNLPLARACAGSLWFTTTSEWLQTTAEEHDAARVNLEEANLSRTHLEGANLIRAFLKQAYLVETHLEEANLSGAHMEDAYLIEVHFEEANLTWAHLEQAMLSGVHLDRASLRGVFFDNGTSLENITLGDKISGFTLLGDIRWGDVDLSVIDWRAVNMLGEEYQAYRTKTRDGKVKNVVTRLNEYQVAVRANRQVAVALQGQGLNEEAARFAYRAQDLEKSVLWYQMTQQGVPFGQRMQILGSWLFSWFLFLIAGYGYRPRRALGWYLLTICGFAWAYYQAWACYHLERVTHHPLSLIGAAIFSITAFHGRGFFLGGDLGYDNLVTILGALEAVIGLLIELSFIATFTQRFFGK